MPGKPNVNVSVTAENRDFRRKMGESQGIMGRFGSSVGRVGLAAGAGLAALGVGAAAVLKGVGNQMEELRTQIVQGTGATGEALDGLMDSAKDVFASVPDSAETVGAALAEVNTRFGTTGEELEALTESALDFARLTGTDAADAIGNLDGAMELFNVDAAESEEVLGDVLRISQATGLGVDELFNRLGKSGGVFQTLGFNIEETTALLGAMEAGGVDLRKAGSGIEFFTDQMLAAGKDPRAEWDLLQDSIQNATDDTEAARIATEALGPSGLSMVGAIRDGSLELEGLMGTGVGLIAEQTAASETLGDKFNELKNTLSVALAPAAEAAFEAVSNGLAKVTPVVQEVLGVFGEEGLSGVLDLLEEKWAFFGRAREIVEETFAVIGDVITVAQEAWGIFGDDIVDIITTTFDFVWERIENTIGFFQGLIDFLTGVFTGDWGQAWDGLKQMFGAFVDEVINTATFAKDMIVEAFQIAWDLISLLWDWSFLGEAIDGAIDAVTSAASAVGSAIIDGILAGVTGAVGFVGDFARGIGNALIDWVNNNVITRINQAIPNDLKILGVGFDLPDNPIDNISRLAAGGVVTSPTLALIGEAGPEAVIPLSRGGGLASAPSSVPFQIILDGQILAEGVAQANRRSGGAIL